jgi:hypothetical protein
MKRQSMILPSLTRGEEMNRDIETTMNNKRLMKMYQTITTVK